MKKITLLFLALTGMLNIANAQDVTVFDFDGTTPAFSSWSDSFVSVANPVPDGVNASANVGMYTHNNQYSEITTTLTTPIDARFCATFQFKVYSPAAGTLKIDCRNAADLNLSSYSVDQSVTAGWTTITQNIVANQPITKIAFSFKLGTVSAADVIYLDDLKIIKTTNPIINLYAENFEADLASWQNFTGAPTVKSGKWKGGTDLQTAGDANMSLVVGWDSNINIHLLNLETTSAAVTIPNINVAGFTNLSLNFQFTIANEGDKIPFIEASIDGGAWATLPTVATGGWWGLGTQSVALPSATSTVSLRINPSTTNPVWFDNFKVTGNLVSTTWNGTAWSNGTPSATEEAIIDGTYSTNTNGAFFAKKLTVNATKSLTINSGTNVTVQNEVINNGSFVVENNANLIQVNNTTNTGAITVNRNGSSLNRLDYTLWSSPVASQNLLAFSPLTSVVVSPLSSRFYNYDATSNLYNTITNPSLTAFATGTGYLIRMPNTDPTSGYDAGSTAISFPGVFTGVPNNGDVTVSMTDGGAGFRYNLVGNPYPSPIIMTKFVADNTANITGTLYFWRKTNGIGTAYCTWTAGTFTTNGNAQTVDPAGIIQTGQGFFVEANSGGTSVTFKNGQRLANTAGQFFKTKQVVATSRVWLNATNLAGDFSQMAVSYIADATLGVDSFDGKYINDSAFALTSNINGDEYTIQGRPAFDASDIVPLNFKTDKAGDYTIAIDHADGLLATGQDVYLVDSTTGTETNLKTDAYTFAATAGVANARFSLKYQKTLKVDVKSFNDNSVVVYRNNSTLYVNSGASAISTIKVFDLQGRLIAEQNNVKANTASINNLKAHQALIVQVTSEDNKIVNKKVVN